MTNSLVAKLISAYSTQGKRQTTLCKRDHLLCHSQKHLPKVLCFHILNRIIFILVLQLSQLRHLVGIENVIVNPIYVANIYGKKAPDNMYNFIHTIKIDNYLSFSFHNVTHNSTKFLLYPFKSHNICILNCVMKQSSSN